ncbi:MAG TPA: amino acid permease [Blastocatellia bacterium]|jgi:APA family basic amino acid/polyamine antiporter|nr:amino acid permease [Blastocatellia bacterium]
MKPEYSESKPVAPTHKSASLARRLGLFDATMIVMGGIIGSGIFINAYIVARQVHTPLLILGAWGAGGFVALIGAFIYAELAALRPAVGGQYAYLREAFHPSVAFIYGWTLLLVTQTGGMAAVAVTFANYFVSLTGAPVSNWAVAVIALAILTVINCFGVRTGSNVQSALMVMKILAIVALVVCGLGGFMGWFGMRAGPDLNAMPASNAITAGGAQPTAAPALSFDFMTVMAAAMIPVLFAYGGWQTSSFVAGEVREPRKNLPLALLLGVIGVIVLYLAVNFVYVVVLGVDALSETQTPASEVMRYVLGERGRVIIAIGIAISTLGFLSQGMLTAPRVYFAMAEDGLFFKGVAWVDPRTRVPVVAIALQGVLAIIIALSGTYAQILNYVVSVDSIFFGLTAACIFVFRRRPAGANASSGGAGFRAPGHPLTTILFIAVEWLVAATTFYKFPKDSLIGMAILFAGIPVYFLWRGGRKR